MVQPPRFHCSQALITGEGMPRGRGDAARSLGERKLRAIVMLTNALSDEKLTVHTLERSIGRSVTVVDHHVRTRHDGRSHVCRDGSRDVGGSYRGICHACTTAWGRRGARAHAEEA